MPNAAPAATPVPIALFISDPCRVSPLLRTRRRPRPPDGPGPGGPVELPLLVPHEGHAEGRRDPAEQEEAGREDDGGGEQDQPGGGGDRQPDRGPRLGGR